MQGLIRKADTFEDSGHRLEELATSMEPRMRVRFLELVASIREETSLDQLVELLQQGRIEEALVGAEFAAKNLGSAWSTMFLEAGQETAGVVRNALEVAFDFDHVNEGAVQIVRTNSLRLVTQFTEEMRFATQQALIDGVRAGLNPNEVARAFRDSIGLTHNQVLAVDNYRRALESQSSTALDRALRDRRFDPTVSRSINGSPLKPEQVSRMVDRYREKMLDYRARVIARTEAHRAVQAANFHAYRQAAEGGIIDPTDVERGWSPTRDARTRDSHESMRGQKRPLDQPFLSGLGNHLLYPGDESAPAEDSILCRCSVVVRFKRPTLAA